jgi:hypothetical protein
MEELGLCDPTEVFAVGPAHRVWVNRDGQTLHDNVGPDHCMLEDARILTVPNGSSYRQYLRDPIGVMWAYATTSDTYATLTSLPADAIDSGYRSGALELWFAPTGSAAYVVTPTGVERWPLGEMVGLCV